MDFRTALADRSEASKNWWLILNASGSGADSSVVISPGILSEG